MDRVRREPGDVQEADESPSAPIEFYRAYPHIRVTKAANTDGRSLLSLRHPARQVE